MGCSEKGHVTCAKKGHGVFRKGTWGVPKGDTNKVLNKEPNKAQPNKAPNKGGRVKFPACRQVPNARARATADRQAKK